jgi:hypothetical protein
MHIPTSRRGNRAQRRTRQQSQITSGRNNMITSPLQCTHATCHPPLGHLIRQAEETGPRAQNLRLARSRVQPTGAISALPEAESSPRAQSPPCPTLGPTFGRFLRLARARPRPPTPPRITWEATPPAVAHVTGGLVRRLRKTSGSPERSSNLDKRNRESRCPAQEH